LVAIENRPAVAWQQRGDMQPSQQWTPNGNQRGENPFEGTPFEDLFNERGFRMEPYAGPERGRQSPQPMPGGIGSGVIIDPAGIILTNNHVVEGGGEVTVKTFDGREFVATQVWTDPKTDLAVVKIDNAADLTAAPLGDSDQVEIGDWVIALGQPFGLESTVTAGIISAKDRGIGITDRESFLQTDAAINPGNSGGPLVNLRGEVIGINTAISTRSGGNNGIGFAVPSNLASWVSQQLLTDGTVHRAYLGVGIQPVTQELAEQLSVSPRSGVAVTQVFADTPAEKAGLRVGDVIVEFDGRKVTTPQQLQLVVERTESGKRVSLEVRRNGKTVQLEFVADEQPSDFAARSPKSKQGSSEQRFENYGLEIAPLDSDVAEQLGMEGVDGVLISHVEPGSPTEQAGLEAGMVVVQVNRQSVSSVEEFAQAVKRQDEKKGMLLVVRTEQGSRFVVVK
jgi:serine protease Do